MATDYAKKTVAELSEILKTRGLQVSGKKAELVARLNEDDKSKVEAEAVADEAVPATEIDSTNTNAFPAAEELAPTTTAAPAAGAEVTTEEAPASTAQDAGTPDTQLANAASYSLNLPTSDLSSEIAKRKARAERFGTGAATASTATNGENAEPAPAQEDENAATLRNLERAKRFGTSNTAITKLDAALPSERERGSKRKHTAIEPESTVSVHDDPGLKPSFASRGRGRGRGGRFRSQAGGREGSSDAARKPQGIVKGKPASAFTSDKDRAAAEARKRKFGTA